MVLECQLDTLGPSSARGHCPSFVRSPQTASHSHELIVPKRRVHTLLLATGLAFVACDRAPTETAIADHVIVATNSCGPADGPIVELYVVPQSDASVVPPTAAHFRVVIPTSRSALRAFAMPITSGPSAQLMYQEVVAADATNKTVRVTLYVRRSDENTATALHFEQQGEVGLFHWVEAESSEHAACAYALVGALPRDRLLAMAEAIVRQR